MPDWIIKFGLNEAGPSAVRGAILGIVGFLIAKSTLLSPYGVVTQGHTTVIDWDKLQMAIVVALPAVTAAIIKLFQFHGTNVAKSLTQSQGGNQ